MTCDQVTGPPASYALPTCVASQTPSPSQSVSQTPSESFTASPTPTARPEQAVVDNTLGRTASFGGFATLPSGARSGVSFSFVEGDAACGPGRYRLTSLGLGLSASGASAVQASARVGLSG